MKPDERGRHQEDDQEGGEILALAGVSAAAAWEPPGRASPAAADAPEFVRPRGPQQRAGAPRGGHEGSPAQSTQPRATAPRNRSARAVRVGPARSTTLQVKPAPAMARWQRR